MFKRIISFLLVAAMAVSFIPAPAMAESPVESETQSSVSLDNGTDLGGILDRSMKESGNVSEDQEESNSILDVTIDGNTATVIYNTEVAAKVVVGLYSEEGQKMLASGSAAVEAGSKRVSFPIETEQMPKNFTITAYLLDAQTSDPLCEEFHSSLYTKNIQEVRDATVDDFEPEKVYNLDQDPKTNFLVFNDGTIQLGKNPSGVTDKGNNTYEFDGTDPRLQELEKGGSVVWNEPNGEMKIIVAKEVHKSGNKVTVVAKSDANADDVFDFIKIETGTISNSDTEAAAYMDEDSDGYRADFEDRSNPDDYWYDAGVWVKPFNVSYGVISGSVVGTYTATIKIYKYFKESQYFQLILDQKYDLKLSVSATKKLTFPIGKEVIPVGVPVVGITVTLSLYVKATAKVQWSCTVSKCNWIVYDDLNGGFDSDGTPFQKTDPTLDLSGIVEFGLEVKVAVGDILEGIIVNGHFVLSVGLNMSATLHMSEVENPDSLHLCEICLDGNTGLVLNLGVGFTVFGFTLGKNLPIKLSETIKWYYSIDEGEGGFGECPNRAYHVDISVRQRRDFQPVPNQEIGLSVGGSALTQVYVQGPGRRPVQVPIPATDENGNMNCYLKDGVYSVSVPGWVENQTLSVKGSPTHMNMFLEDQPTMALSKEETKLGIHDAPMQLTASLVQTGKRDVTKLSTWTSSDPKVATVEGGLVKPLAEGTTVIKATYKQSGNLTLEAECTVTVVGEFYLSENGMELYTTDEAGKLDAFLWSGQKNVTTLCTWTSSNDKIVQVKSGRVIPVAPGTAEVKASYTVGKETKEAICKVTVKQGLKISQEELQLAIGGAPVALNVVLVSNSEDVTAKCSWTSSNPKAVKVTGGRLTAVEPGTAVVTASYKAGDHTCTVSCKVTVAGIWLSQVKMIMQEGGKPEQLTVMRSDGSYVTEKCKWVSTNSRVVTVKNGLVTPVGAGVATINTEFTDGEIKYTAACAVIVTAKNGGLVLSKDPVKLQKGGDPFQLQVYRGNDKTDLSAKCVWESLDNDVVKVKGGLLTPVNPGMTTIYAAYADKDGNTYTILGSVIVIDPKSTDLTLEPASLQLKPGETGSLKVTQTSTGLDVTEECSYLSMDEGVVMVKGTTLTAGHAGATEVLVSYGGSTVSCPVLVFDREIIASGTCGDTMNWILDGTGMLSILGTGKMYDYDGTTAPWRDYAYRYKVKTLNITSGVESIGKSAFSSMDITGDLVIPDSVTSIRNNAFSSCQKFDGTLTLSQNLESIGEYAFYETTFTGDLVIPDSVTSIGDSAFYYCQKFDGTLTLSQHLESIGKSAFQSTTFTGDLVIPDSVTSIGDSAFSYGRFDGTLTLSKNLTDIPCGCFDFCSSLTGDLVIPEGVVSIGDSAFYWCSKLDGELTLSKSLETIGKQAFGKDSRLTGDLMIPDSVTSIGNEAFYECSGFSGDLTLPTSLTSLGTQAFFKCSGFTGDLVIPGSLQEIPAGAFNQFGKGSGYLTIKAGVTKIGSGAFIDAKLTGDLEIPDTVTEIGASAFSGTTFNGLTLSQNLKTLGDYAFSGCTQLTGDLILPDSLTAIPDHAFDLIFPNGGFTGKLKLPKSLKQIGNQAFNYQTKLTGNLELPETLTSIGSSAFYSCSSFQGGLVIPEGVKNNLGGSAFAGCSGLNGVLVLPEGMTAIPESAFIGCSRLTGLKMSSKLRSIGASAFQNCAGLRGDLILPETLNTLGTKAFSAAEFTGTLHIPSKLREIPEGAFADTKFSGSLVIPGNITTIGKSAFNLCKNIMSLTLSQGIKTIGEQAFMLCQGLQEDLVIPEGVTKVGESAFRYCRDTDKVAYDLYLPRSLVEIGYGAFANAIGCEFVHVYYAGTAAEWANVKDNSKLRNVIFNTPYGLALEGEEEAVVIDGLEEFEEPEEPEVTEVPEETTEITETEVPETEEEPTETMEPETNVSEEPAEELPEENLEGYYVAPEGARMEDEGEMLPMSAHTGKESVSGGVRSVALVGLEPGEEYVLIVSLNPGSVAPKDLEYIAQGTADSKGSLSFRYIPREDVSAIVQLYGLPTQRYITLDQEYLTLQAGTAPVTLQAKVEPENWAKYLTWTAEQNEWEDTVIRVGADGSVTPVNPGTAYAVAQVTYRGETLTARCRIDVTEMEPEAEIWSVDLGSQKVTTELYSTDYTVLDILPRLEQNEVAAYNAQETEGAVTGAELLNGEAARYFRLQVKDDRHLLLVPTQTAIQANAKDVKSSYASSVAVYVNGEEFITQPVTITVKKTMPKLKAGALTFNSFYTGQSQALKVTGGTVTKIEQDTGAKGYKWPDWLELNGTGLTLKNAPKSGSANLNLLVYTQEWSVPVSLKVSAKLSQKAPAVKLSASSVTLSDAAGQGTVLKLTAGKQSLEELNVKGIRLPAGFRETELNLATGEFRLVPEGSVIPTGKQTVGVRFYGTDTLLELPLTIKAATPTLKLSKSSVSLNGELGDEVTLKVTANPADLDLTKVTVQNLNEALTISKVNEDGEFTVAVKKGTAPKMSCTLTLQAPTGKAAKLTVKTLNAGQKVTMNLKATGDLDLTYPEKGVTLTPTFQNYSGSLANVRYGLTLKQGKVSQEADFAQYLKIGADGKLYAIGALANGMTAAVTMTGTLPDGTELSAAAQVKVTETGIPLKLSKSSLTLNKKLNEWGTVEVSTTAKGYTLGTPSIRVTDGKNVPTDALAATYEAGKLTVALGENAQYGASYKVLLWVTTNKVSTLNVKVPAEKASDVTVTAKATGSIDPIRSASEIVITPSYKNYLGQVDLAKDAVITWAQDGKNFAKDVTGSFRLGWSADGKLHVRRAGNVSLIGAYRLELTVEGASKPAYVKLNVKSGSAKLTAEPVVLYAKDGNSRAELKFSSTDPTLNPVNRVTLKDAKQANTYRLRRLEDGTYVLSFQDEAVRKSGSVALNVFIAGNTTRTPNTTVTVKVEVR